MAFRLLTAARLLALGMAVSCRGGKTGSTPPTVTIDNNGATSWIQIQGDPPGSDIGTFDPSVRKASNGTIVMSYSSVDQGRNKINTRIATSNDGVTFTYAAEAAQAEENVDVTVAGDSDCPTGTCTGANLVHETSALVEDPTDPDAAAHWKIFTHRYVILKDPLDPNTPNLKYAYGTISMVTASSPSGPWSDPIPMIGWNSNAPISSTGSTLTLVSQLDGMNDCLYLTEPSAVVDPGTGFLELALGCIFLQQNVWSIRIELVRSPDHGKNWTHAHRLMEASDSTRVGGTVTQMNAAHLFDRGGKRYLIASPDGPVTLLGVINTTGYRGCLVFRRTDDGIERDGAGAPVVYGRIDPGDGVFAGACSDIPDGGYVLSAMSDISPYFFRMYGPIGKELP